MSFSQALLTEVQAAVEKSAQSKDAYLQHDIEWARRELAVIPELIAAAHARKQDYAVLANFYESSCNHFRVFVYPSWKERMFSKAPKREWLCRLGKLMYDECARLGLQPTMSKCHRDYPDGGGRWSSPTRRYLCSELVLHWNPQHLDNLLKKKYPEPIVCQSFEAAQQEVRTGIKHGEVVLLVAGVTSILKGVDDIFYLNGAYFGRIWKENQLMSYGFADIDNVLASADRRPRTLRIWGSFENTREREFLISRVCLEDESETT